MWFPIGPPTPQSGYTLQYYCSHNMMHDFNPSPCPPSDGICATSSQRHHPEAQALTSRELRAWSIVNSGPDEGTTPLQKPCPAPPARLRGGLLSWRSGVNRTTGTSRLYYLKEIHSERQTDLLFGGLSKDNLFFMKTFFCCRIIATSFYKDYRLSQTYIIYIMRRMSSCYEAVSRLKYQKMMTLILCRNI